MTLRLAVRTRFAAGECETRPVVLKAQKQSCRAVRRRCAGRRIIAFAVVAVAAAMVAACASGPAAPWADLGGANSIAKPYTLKSGDELAVVVFNEPDLSGTFPVGADGMVAVPLIGPLKGRGETADAFKRQLERKLSGGYLKSPKITVRIAKYRPVFIHGEVKEPGEFQFQTGLTIANAIAQAGGFTYRAEEGHVILTRDGLGGPVRVALPTTATVEPGDNIRVPERFF